MAKRPAKWETEEQELAGVYADNERLRTENRLLRDVAEAAEVAVRKSEASLILHARAKTYHHHTSPCTLEAIAAFKATLARLREHREGHDG